MIRDSITITPKQSSSKTTEVPNPPSLRSRDQQWVRLGGALEEHAVRFRV